MEKRNDITEIVKKMCPYYYDLDPIMGTRVSCTFSTVFVCL
jgi:hypothetical protein